MYKPLSSLIIVLSVFLCFTLSAKEKVKKASHPTWVNKIEFSENSMMEDIGGYQYLLVDKQTNLPQETFYAHTVVKVTSASGIQDISDISVDFDPTYQTLTFHQIDIIRNGERISKLSRQKINTFQRETNLERSLYNGQISAVVNLEDVRQNDIIEYSYSVVGSNPVNKGDYSTTTYFQFTVPVNKVFYRLISKKPIFYKTFSNAPEPSIKKEKWLTEYTWDVSGSSYSIYENSSPSWFDNQSRVQISTLKNWSDIVNWANKLYQYSTQEISSLKKSYTTSTTKEETILNIIRYVQNEIRYLGFEGGINNYKPNSPLKVNQQRFGDCKDKSLLLVALLRNENIDAHPVLVNSNLGKTIEEHLPSAGVFNHCVVYFSLNSNDFFVDPTINNQGGNIHNIHFPNYEKGLIIREGENTLIDLPHPKAPQVIIHEKLKVNEIGEGADFKVITKYTGGKADYFRDYFASNSKEAIKKEYTDYYSILYPSIKSSKEIVTSDNHFDSKNIFTVEEHYHIDSIWTKDLGSGAYICETSPLVLQSLIDYGNTTIRKTPFWLGSLSGFKQTTVLQLPEEWSVEPSTTNINGDGFSYSSEVSKKKNDIIITHDYTLLKNYIVPSSYDRFIKKHNEIKNQLAYQVTQYPSSEGISWLGYSIILLILGIGTFLAFKTYYNYDPEVISSLKNLEIGGWLILPAIGLCLSPFVLAFQIFTLEGISFLNIENIEALSNSTSYATILIILAELVYNILYLIFTILIIVLFFKRRSSLPRLITIYFIVSFLGPLLDYLLVSEYVSGYFSQSEKNAVFGSIAKSFIKAAIWIPYFNISQRCKDTFTIKLKKNINEVNIEDSVSIQTN